MNKQLEAGVIERTKSEWAAPVLFAVNKDLRRRSSIDYQHLNAVSRGDSCQLPRMDECIHSLGASRVFTPLDANSVHFKSPMSLCDRQKTSFVCHAVSFRYMRMPIVLQTAPARFQRELGLILSQYKWISCLVYLYHVIVYSNSLEDHIDQVDAGLTALVHA